MPRSFDKQQKAAQYYPESRAREAAKYVRTTALAFLREKATREDLRRACLEAAEILGRPEAEGAP